MLEFSSPWAKWNSRDQVGSLKSTMRIPNGLKVTPGCPSPAHNKSEQSSRCHAAKPYASRPTLAGGTITWKDC